MITRTDVQVTSAINIFVKDSGLVAQAGASCGAQRPLLDVGHARFCEAAEMGLSLHDNNRVIEIW